MLGYQVVAELGKGSECKFFSYDAERSRFLWLRIAENWAVEASVKRVNRVKKEDAAQYITGACCASAVGKKVGQRMTKEKTAEETENLTEAVEEWMLDRLRPMARKCARSRVAPGG
jgi:hypothetical protein